MTIAELDRIETLEAEVAYWKAEAQRNVEVDTVTRLRDAFGLTPAEAWLVGMLYAANGRVVRRERLCEDVPGGSWEDRAEGSNIVEVFVSKARRKIGRDSIETVRYHGYRIAPAMAARIDAVLT